MKKVYIQSRVGCGYRMLDAQRFCNYFLKNNHRIVHNPKEADYIIFVTCGISNAMAEICLGIIKKFNKYDAELIVVGCLPAIRPKLIAENFGGKIIVTDDLIHNPDKIDQLFPENKIKFKYIDDPSIIEYQDNEGNLLQRLKNKINAVEMEKTSTLLGIITLSIPIKIRRHILNNLLGENTVISHYNSILTHNSDYCIRVSWGCTGNCTYCGSKKAVGAHVSKPIEQILTEFKKGLRMGYKSFYISAEDVGSYGLDIDSSLPELLDKITEIEGDYEIFLGGLNPVWVVKYVDSLEKIFKKGKIQHMECPIQSGSSRILKLMHRYSNIEKIKDAYNRLRKSYPDLLLYPHIMLGFPTETDEDAEQTLSFIKEMNFNSGQVFNCSCIPGTEAVDIEPKVPKEVISERTKYVKKFLKREGYIVIWPNRPKGVGYFYR